jgi:hypothetical protein
MTWREGLAVFARAFAEVFLVVLLAGLAVHLIEGGARGLHEGPWGQ